MAHFCADELIELKKALEKVLGMSNKNHVFEPIDVCWIVCVDTLENLDFSNGKKMQNPIKILVVIIIVWVKCAVK